MRILNTKFRIIIGQVGLITSLVMLAFFFNIVPDEVTAIRQGRTSLAESIAVYSTEMVIIADIERMEGDFNLLVERNPDLLSLALRRTDGFLLVKTEGHIDNWMPMTGEFSKESQVRVPIWSGSSKWGQLELRYMPILRPGIMGVLQSPMVQLVAFLGLGCFVFFYFYLGKMLRHLDPSSAIPARVREALDTMAEGLLILDRREQIVLANIAFSSMLGKSPDELLGHRAGDLPWHDPVGDMLQKHQRPWIRALREGLTQKDEILKLKFPDNFWRTFKTNCTPVLGSAGKYAGVLVSFNDITQLQEKEVELRKSKEVAEQANKAKSAFLANMSHDIRTPMNAILGFTEILMRGYVRNEKDSLRHLGTIHTSGKNLLELINDILDLSKIESGHLDVDKTWIEPYRIIHEVIQMLSVKAREKNLSLGFSAAGPLPQKIETDPLRLRQMIFNLLGNAIKFTNQGSITLVCSYMKKPDTTLLQIDVVDTGIGVRPDRQEAIFDPFEQADSTVTSQFGGTGLGLAISREFARVLGGDITMTSVVGEGSTFSITLATGNLQDVPFLTPAEAAQQEKMPVESATSRWQFPESRVLVVDDGAENRELVRLILEDAGLHVVEAENGLAGVEKATSEKFDVILMDVQMPVMDGFTATGKLREIGLQAPIIALTANAMKGFEEECIAAGFSGFFSKPIVIDTFMDKMASLLGGERLPDETAGSPPTADQTVGTAEMAGAAPAPIISKLPGDNEKFQKLVVAFANRLEEQLEAFERAAAEKDFAEVAALSHWLKGAGGTVGFDVFTGPAGNLEKLAKEQRTAEVNQGIRELRALARRLYIPSAHLPEPPDPGLSAGPMLTPKEPPADQPPVISSLAANDKFKHIVLKFTDRLKEQEHLMDRALEQDDLEELANLALWLKGESGTVGYIDFTEPAEQLFNAARSGLAEQAGLQYGQIKRMMQAVVPPTVD